MAKKKTSKKKSSTIKKMGGGSVTSVRGRGPNVSPRVNVLGEAAARAHQAVRRANPPRSRALSAPGPLAGGVGAGGRQAPQADLQSASNKRGRRPAPRIRPGYKVGGPVPEINDALLAKYFGGGSVTSVRGRGGPHVNPRVNVLGEAAARAHQRAQRGGLAGQQRPTVQPSLPPRQPAVMQARRGRGPRRPGGGV